MPFGGFPSCALEVIITMQWTSGHAAVLAAGGPPSTGERGPRFELMSVWQ
jgi:hypothetical protein